MLCCFRYETFPTYYTVVRPFPGMCFNMISIRRSMSKVFTTITTHKRLLPCVDSFMFFELILLGETFIALKALKRSVTCVCPDVILQFFFRCYFLTTNITYNRPIGTGIVVITIHMPLKTCEGFIVLTANFAVVFRKRFSEHQLVMSRSSMFS